MKKPLPAPMGADSTPDSTSDSGAISWLRNNRAALGFTGLLALGTAAGCTPDEKPEPIPDEDAPWILREPQEMVPADEMCFPSTIPVEVADSLEIEKLPTSPYTRPVRRGESAEYVTRTMYERIRTTGEYEVKYRDDGGTLVSFIPTDGAYDDLLAMYPMIPEEAANRNTPNSDLDLSGGVIAEWRGAEAQRVNINRRIEEFRLLRQCLGFENDDATFQAIAEGQEPFPMSWTDGFIADPIDPGVFSGQELFDGQAINIPPFVPPEGKTLRYVSFTKKKGDHLSVLLEQVVDPKYHDQIARLAVFVRLTSEGGEWRIPAEYLNPEEQLGILARSLELPEADPSALYKKYWGRRTGSLRGKMLQAQYDYHRDNNYPIFTESNRDELISQLTVEGDDGAPASLVDVTPTDQDNYIIRYIYERDPENSDKAAYAQVETLTLLDGMAEAVDQALHAAGVPDHLQVKVIGTSFLRTAEYYGALSSSQTLDQYLTGRAGQLTANINAARVKYDEEGNIEAIGAHGCANAADISTTKIALVDKNTGTVYVLREKENPALFEIAKVAMYQYLANQEEAGLALGAPEGNHVHIVGVRPPEEEPSEEAKRGSLERP
jgi:hypothetical protein